MFQRVDPVIEAGHEGVAGAFEFLVLAFVDPQIDELPSPRQKTK
jgi:hypothetical protein